MLKLKNPRIIIILFLVAAIVFFMYSDQIVGYINPLNPIAILVISTLLNPVYLILIYMLYTNYGFRGAIGGFLISTASDVISLPHFILRSGQPATASLTLLSENTFYSLLPAFLKTKTDLPIIGQVNLGVFLVYVIISTGLVVLALMITHKKKFKEIFAKSI